MQPAVGGMCGDVSFQAGGGFQPVIDVMTGHAAALLVEVIRILADIVLGGYSKGSSRAGGGLIFHRCCWFRHKGD